MIKVNIHVRHRIFSEPILKVCNYFLRQQQQQLQLQQLLLRLHRESSLDIVNGLNILE